jgi:hypothetical protein
MLCEVHASFFSCAAQLYPSLRDVRLSNDSRSGRRTSLTPSSLCDRLADAGRLNQRYARHRRPSPLGDSDWPCVHEGLLLAKKDRCYRTAPTRILSFLSRGSRKLRRVYNASAWRSGVGLCLRRNPTRNNQVKVRQGRLGLRRDCLPGAFVFSPWTPCHAFQNPLPSIVGHLFSCFFSGFFCGDDGDCGAGFRAAGPPMTYGSWFLTICSLMAAS